MSRISASLKFIKLIKAFRHLELVRLAWVNTFHRVQVP
jgi:hypothetical protein